MPFPILSAALAGVQSLTSIYTNRENNKAVENRNAEDRQFQMDMYNRQRRDSLSDWAMQNDYNSPKAQMQRLKDAGLNPNLVYGNGATATGGDIRSSSPGSYSPQAKNYSGISDAMNTGLNMFYDMQLKDAQLDNLQAAKTVQEQDALLKAAQLQNTLQDVHTKDFDLKMKNELKDINVDMARKNLEKLDVDVSSAGNDLMTKNITQGDTIKKAQAEARKALNEADASDRLKERVNQELENLKKDGDIKQFQINLNKLGITSSDPIWARILTTLFGKYIPKF